MEIWKRKLSDRDLAGYVVRKLIKPVMNAEQSECFGLGCTESQDNIMVHLFLRVFRDYQTFWKTTISKTPPLDIGKTAALVHQINIWTIFALLGKLNRKTSNIELKQSIIEDS